MLIPDDAAQAAAASVRSLFLRRSLGVPGTRLGAVEHPAPARPGHWHYWWQAHLLDCLIDAGLRDPSGDSLTAARKLARGIRLRNGGRWRNSYYDDMAWLALALQRLDQQGDPRGPDRPRRPVRVLGAALASAHTGELGGGVYWNTTRDYKNTPSTAPAALFFARAGRTKRAQELLDWLRDRLHDDATGLYLDGVRADGSVERTVHTYNQGTVLGALVAVGGQDNLSRAADLIRGVRDHLADRHGVLPLHADGDAGLFTGILTRYLAVAAVEPDLAVVEPADADLSAGGGDVDGDGEVDGHGDGDGDVDVDSDDAHDGSGTTTAAASARFMVRATAEHVWRGRRPTDDGGTVFPPLTDGSTSLSSQVQAWTILEAERACRLR